MDRLRKAYQALAVVLIPVTAVYSFHVLQYPTGPVGRAEAALRSAVAVGAVIWAVFYVGRIIGENRAHRQAVGRVQVLRENTVPMPVVPQPDVAASSRTETPRRSRRRRQPSRADVEIAYELGQMSTKRPEAN